MNRRTWLYAGGAVAAVVAFVWWRSRSGAAAAAATAPYTSTPVYGYNPAGYNPQDSGGDSGLSPTPSGSTDYTDPASTVGTGASTGGGNAYVGGTSQVLSYYGPGTFPGTGTTASSFNAPGTTVGSLPGLPPNVAGGQSFGGGINYGGGIKGFALPR